MGEVGRWDPDLFDRFRAARPGSVKRNYLLGELLRINEPLVKVLVAQLGGQPPSAQVAGNLRNRMKVPGAERLEWEAALNAGRIALWKALERFDPAKGKISFYLKWKVRHELQVLVGATSVVRVQRGERAPGVEYVEDDKHLDWLTREGFAGDVDIEAALPAGVPIWEWWDEASPKMRAEFARLMRAVADGTRTKADLLTMIGQAPPPPPPRPPPPPVAFDTRTALEVLLEECRFVPSARTPASSVRGRYYWLARERGEWVERGVLTRALGERGVREATMRVPWWPVPLRGFRGISLQSAAKTSCAHDRG